MNAILTTMLTLAVGTSADGLLAEKLTVQVYPSGPTVPENLLRIELRFSEPLRIPLGTDYVRLLDVNDREIEQPFLDLELPSLDGKRLTILLHPGRVKDGVGANLALGRALHDRSTVTLVIDHPELTSAVRKTWQVTSFDADGPRPEHWTFEPPQRGSRSLLVVHLDEPISSPAEALIAVRGPNGLRLGGTARLQDGETVWCFVPEQPWEEGRYALVTHPELEDPAGNRPCGPFEGINASRIHCDKETVRPFEPWPGPNDLGDEQR